MKGANFSFRIGTSSKKNLTHLAVLSSQFVGELATAASTFNLHVGKSNKSTTGVNSVKIGGETDVSIRLKSTTSLLQMIVPVPVTNGSDSTRVVIARQFYIIRISWFCYVTATL